MSVSWKEWLNLGYYPAEYGRMSDFSFRRVHLNDFRPDQIQEIINKGADLKWHDTAGRSLAYHLVDVSCGFKPISAESLDVFLKNGMAPNSNVNAILEHPLSLMEKIAHDENASRREEYFSCLFKNGLDVSWESCGRKTIFTLMALHKEQAAHEVQMILDKGQIDVAQPDGPHARSILDWADNGYLCDSRNREVIYSHYHKSNPKKAGKREKTTEPLFLSQQEGRWAQEKCQSVREERELMDRIFQEQKKRNFSSGATSEVPLLQIIMENLNEEMIRQGVQLLHCAGKVIAAAGEQAQKIDTQDIKFPSAQKIRDLFNALTR